MIIGSFVTGILCIIIAKILYNRNCMILEEKLRLEATLRSYGSKLGYNISEGYLDHPYLRNYMNRSVSIRHGCRDRVNYYKEELV